MNQEYEDKMPSQFIQVANMLAGLSEDQEAPWQKPFPMGQELPFNPETGKPYHGINTMILMAAGYEDPRWMTYGEAQKQGAQVKKGEKGTAIQFWQYMENGVRLERPKVFWTTVFNASQMDGPEKLITKERSEAQIFEAAKGIIENSGVKIQEYTQGRFSVYYDVETDTIHMAKRERYSNEIDFYRDAINGIAMATSQEGRLNRKLDGPLGGNDHSFEQLRVSMASLLITKEIGMPFIPSSQSIMESQRWAELIRKDPKALYRAASDAEKIKRYATLGLTQEQTVDRTRADSLTSSFEQKKETPQRVMQTEDNRINQWVEKQLEQTRSYFTTGEEHRLVCQMLAPLIGTKEKSPFYDWANFNWPEELTPVKDEHKNLYRAYQEILSVKEKLSQEYVQENYAMFLDELVAEQGIQHPVQEVFENKSAIEIETEKQQDSMRVYVHMQTEDGRVATYLAPLEEFYANTDRLHVDEETVVFEQTTVEEVRKFSDWLIPATAQDAPPETILYRADYLQGQAEGYTTKPIDKFAAYKAFLKHRRDIDLPPKN